MSNATLEINAEKAIAFASLSPRDVPELAEAVDAIYEVVKQQGKEIRDLSLTKAALECLSVEMGHDGEINLEVMRRASKYPHELAAALQKRRLLALEAEIRQLKEAISYYGIPDRAPGSDTDDTEKLL